MLLSQKITACIRLFAACGSILAAQMRLLSRQHAGCPDAGPCAKCMRLKAAACRLDHASLDERLRPGALLKADRVANLLAQSAVHLFRYSPSDGHSRHPSWLRAGDGLATLCVPSLSHKLSDLGGLPTARFTNKDGCLVAIDHLDEFLLRLPHGQPCEACPSRARERVG
eukprot:366097-Chlamydomonas_euryale.AAC.15